MIQNNQKKRLLEKLTDNLLGKPTRSMHEVINGVKESIAAYKNYAKEWDNLNGINNNNESKNAIDAVSNLNNKNKINDKSKSA
jgi:hypothetical protein